MSAILQSSTVSAPRRAFTKFGSREPSGQVCCNSTDGIACWFIDANYDGESFSVRHAYFTGADEPYDTLKRALRAEIDEAARATLCSTVSRGIAPPAAGEIAVRASAATGTRC